MKLYHGSNKEVVKPIYGYGRADCDYGSGFYMSDDYNAASMWASNNPAGGYINTYELDLKSLNVLYLNHNTDKDVLKWVAILCKHRIDENTRLEASEEINLLINRYCPKLDDIDVIVGYRADDSYYIYTREFLLNNLPLELLKRAMELGNLGLQYVLISKKAFNKIKFIDSKIISHNDEYAKLEEKANNEYELLVLNKNIKQKYVRDILRDNS
ncbi:MAG: DUF3990 domain-containing protein [Erysipelotrichaceae bacterium]|nr:DUF3990 domain-containing protein [Erysipelotrichaceae bacterium]